MRSDAILPQVEQALLQHAPKWTWSQSIEHYLCQVVRRLQCEKLIGLFVQFKVPEVLSDITYGYTTTKETKRLFALVNSDHNLLRQLCENGYNDPIFLYITKSGSTKVSLLEGAIRLRVTDANVYNTCLTDSRGVRVGIHSIRLTGGEYALHLAARLGYDDVCTVLIQLGADVQLLSSNNCSALSLAVTSNHAATCAVLLQSGASNTVTPQERNEFLCRAASMGLEAFCQTLVQSGADVNYRDASSKTALCYAAEVGNANICALLVDRGAKLTQDDDQLLMLHAAAKKGQAQIIQLLVSAGLSVNHRDSSNKTALCYAAEGGHTEICTFLYDKGARFTHKDGQFHLLHDAAKKGRLELSRALVHAGLHACERDREYNTALHYAAQINDIEMVKFLLENGSDISMVNLKGKKAEDLTTSGEVFAILHGNVVNTKKIPAFSETFNSFVATQQSYLANEWTNLEKTMCSTLEKRRAAMEQELAELRKTMDLESAKIEESRAIAAANFEKQRQEQEKQVEEELAAAQKSIDALYARIDSLTKKLHAASLREDIDEEEIELNVGGECFTTTAMNLTSIKPTFFTAMLSKDGFGVKKNKKGQLVIDRDPTYFKIILNYLRGNHETTKRYILDLVANKKLFELRSLYDEVSFYAIEPLVELVQPHIVA